MRGLISEHGPGALGIACALRGAIPAVYQEDPLFMQLCAALDELMAPLVTAVDCFDAYLDPRLAPADYLPWLAGLVGYQGTNIRPGEPDRERIVSAVRDHGRRGTALGVREAAARAAGVPVEQVRLDDPGATRWSTIAGGAASAAGWPVHTAAHVRVSVRPATHYGTENQDPEKLRAAVQVAVDAAAGVHCAIAVDVVAAEQRPGESGDGDTARPRRAGPGGARTYGGGEP